MELRDIILKLALPLIEAQNLELWGLDITPGPTLRVALYVDGNPDGENATGASIDQCESISRQLSLAMDVEDCIDQAWTLEVSSPGLERKFFRLSQLAPYIGDVLDVRLDRPDAGRKRWRGRLLAVSDDGFELEPVSVSADGQVTPDGDGPVHIAWADVARAQRVYIYQAPPKPGKGQKKK